MRPVRRQPWLWLMLFVAGLAPIMSACALPTPSPTEASATTPLPQVVEAYMAELPGPSPKLFMSTRVYDREGVLIGEFWQDGHRYWTRLDQIAPYVRQATVSTEDKTFYTNPGIDWSAIARAVLQNSGEGEVISGASTITQQLARNIAMPYEQRIQQSLNRKLSETMLAQDLNERFGKDQILEMYLNVVNYGHMAYGIEAAAQTYFGKSASDLTVAESALLAALPQSPAALDPLIPANGDRAKARQGMVLALMVRSGYLKASEAQAAYAETLQYRTRQLSQTAPHFLQYVRESLISQFGKDAVERGGFNVYTTLDLRMQSKAQAIVRQQVDSVRAKYNLSNAALVAIQPTTGQILAMVGSADFNNSAIDGQVNVTISRRQPGSAIKPVLYSLAFTRGLNPADIISDSPVAYPLTNGTVYRPVNYDGRFHGNVRLRTALANSYNVPAVKLLNQLGVPDMVDMAHSFGLASLDRPVAQYGLSLTLGGAEVTPLELTGAFATLANGGVRMPPTPFVRITDAIGREIQRFGQPAQAVVDPRVAYMVTSILSDNDARTPAFGPNSPLKLTRPAAAKTGTTTDWRDNWTVGYTPYIAVGVWAGNSNGKPMVNTTGLTGAAPIWHDFMEAVFADPNMERLVRKPSDPLTFQRPPGLLDMPICGTGAVKASAACPPGKTDLFLDPARPIRVSLASAATATRTVPATTTVASNKTAGPAVTVIRGVMLGASQACSTDKDGQALTVVHAPDDPQGKAAAVRLAADLGLPIDSGPCTPEMLRAAQTKVDTSVVNVTSPQTQPAPAATALIAAPAPDSTITGPIDVIGTVGFDKEIYQYYRLEYGYGSNPSQWAIVGTVHPDPVYGGRLETWQADALPNGQYALRIVLVKADGNYVAMGSMPVIIRH